MRLRKYFFALLAVVLYLPEVSAEFEVIPVNTKPNKWALSGHFVDGSELITDEDGNLTFPTILTAYRHAAAYAMHGDSDKALRYLEEWFRDGDFALNFEYARHDWRFDNIKHLPEFTQHIDRYKQRWLHGEYRVKR